MLSSAHLESVPGHLNRWLEDDFPGQPAMLRMQSFPASQLSRRAYSQSTNGRRLVGVRIHCLIGKRRSSLAEVDLGVASLGCAHKSKTTTANTAMESSDNTNAQRGADNLSEEGVPSEVVG